MPKKDNPHKEHRLRVRNEFLENGFSDSTPPHKILEMLLFYSIPRKDTNEIAHALLNRFGTVSDILEATPAELMTVDGIGENSAALLKLMLPIFRRYENSKSDRGKSFNSADEICEFLEKKYVGFSKEVFAVTTLDSRGRVIAFDILNQGDPSSVTITTRSVVEKVLERKAVCVVLSHNHPKGNALPSQADIETTVRLCSALSHINIRLLDHVVLCDDDYVSMAQSEQFQYIFK